jgi:hypothetical protein
LFAARKAASCFAYAYTTNGHGVRHVDADIPWHVVDKDDPYACTCIQAVGRETRHEATVEQLMAALTGNDADLETRVTGVITALGVWKQDADLPPSSVINVATIYEIYDDEPNAEMLVHAVEYIFNAFDFTTGTFPKYPTFDHLPDLRNEAVAAGKAARILCSTRLAEASLAASVHAAAATTAAETKSRAQRRKQNKAKKRSDANIPSPSSIESAAAISSASSTQAAPSGVENADTAHQPSNIAVHKTKINKTIVVHAEDILFMLAFFAVIIDVVAVVVKNNMCIYSICVLVSLASVYSVANALTPGSTVLSTRVSVADADARVCTASIPDG